MSIDAQQDDRTRSDVPLRQILITAISGRIAERRLTAAQTAAILHLTGPRVTELLAGNTDMVTLDELVAFLPPLGLAICVVPEANW